MKAKGGGLSRWARFVSMSVPMKGNSKNVSTFDIHKTLLRGSWEFYSLELKGDLIWFPPLTASETSNLFSRLKETLSPLISAEDTTSFLSFWPIEEIKHLGHTCYTLGAQSMLVLVHISITLGIGSFWMNMISESFIYEFMYSFKKCSWKTCYVPGTIEGSREKIGNTRA